jgi:hypothetical protein
MLAGVAGAPVAVEPRAVHACSGSPAVRSRAWPFVARHGRARAPRAPEVAWLDTAPEENAGTVRTKRPKRVTRREASHSRTPVSARGVEVIARVLFFDKQGLHVLDRRTLLRRLRKEVRRCTPRPGSRVLAGARDEGLVIGAAPAPDFDSIRAPEPARTGAPRSKGRGVPRVRSSGGRENRPPLRTPGFRVELPRRGISPRPQFGVRPRGARITGRIASDGYERHEPPQPTAQMTRGAHVAPPRTIPIKAGARLTAPPSAPDRAGANLAGPSGGTLFAVDGASVSGSRSR